MAANGKGKSTVAEVYRIPSAPPPGWIEYTWANGKGWFRYRKGDVVEIPHLRCYVEGSSNQIDLSSDEEAT